MKIQLDFNNKVIKLDEKVNIGELFEKLEKVVPNWHEWELDVTSEIIWKTSPIVVQRPYWETPWWRDRWVYRGTDPLYSTIQVANSSGDGFASYQVPAIGVFNLEV